jgi:uncharacterized protein YutE (UPF0331/DUF86 family)
MSTNIAGPEKITLDRLREDFQAKGYQFIAEPSSDQVPDFLGAHRPDALAIGPHDNVIIEVKRQGSRALKIPPAQLAQKIASQSGWRYLLVYAGEDPSDIIELSRPQKSQVDRAIEEARRLEQSGHFRAAMIEGWSLLEALARRLHTEDIRFSLRPLSPMQVVERLAMDGQLDAEEAKRLRALSSIRNSVVHGDLNVSVSGDDVRFLLGQVETINARLSA